MGQKRQLFFREIIYEAKQTMLRVQPVGSLKQMRGNDTASATVRASIDLSRKNVAILEVFDVDTVRRDIEHVIDSGDSLPKISRKYYGHSKYWKHLAEYNQLDVIQRKVDDEVLYSVHIEKGQRLRIPTF